VVSEVGDELARSVERARTAGVLRDRLVIDPGLGFAKRPEHNFQLLRRLDRLAGLGLPIMVGPSRKRFLGEVTGKDVGDRDAATAAACVAAYLGGASLFRVHAVGPVVDALKVAHAIREAGA
jgi:dihydropteroate synthase